MKDEACRNIMDFSLKEWSVYDCVDDFVGVPTFCYLAASGGDVLVFRPSSFLDSDCIGLNALIGRIDIKGKRKQNQSPDTSSPFKKTRKSGDKLQVEVLDWTTL